jgi:hypothetical protein
MKDFESYRRYGHKFVSGWLKPEVLDIMSVLDAAQRAKSVSGAVAEIGVHHGKLFIGLQLLQDANGRAVAVDVFSNQELNIDNSGKGNLEVFRKNMRRWSSSSNVAIHQGDSTCLQPDELRKLAGADIRLFSVDGGHTDSIVFNDMKLAEATLAEGGIVIADDIFNQEWPGVSVGTFRYLDEGGVLLPFAVGFNKVFFARAEFVQCYRDALQQAFSNRFLTSVRTADFGKNEVAIIARVPRTPARLAGRIGVVKAAYHHLQNRLGR